VWLALLATACLMEQGVTTDPLPTLQFELDVEAIRVLHRSVSFHLEKWPGGPDPREQQALVRMKTLLTAALLECSFGQEGQR
jgi:hypothetical protein